MNLDVLHDYGKQFMVILFLKNHELNYIYLRLF